MKRKIILSVFIILVLCAFLVVGKYSNKYCFQDNNEERKSESESSININSENESNHSFSDSNSFNAEGDIYYYVQADVKENILFAQFLNNEIKATDIVEDSNQYFEFDYYGKEFYIKDLYINYWENNMRDSYKGIDGIQVFSKDMNEDGKNELLILIEYYDEEGDLHVFEEKDGKLYVWECWRNLRTMRSPVVKIYDNGMIWCGGSGNESFTKYNGDGEIENILMYSYQRESVESDEKGVFLYYYELTLYDNGNVIERLSYEQYDNRLTDEEKITSENDEIRQQCTAIFQQMEKKCGEAEIIEETQGLDKSDMIMFTELVK